MIQKMAVFAGQGAQFVGMGKDLAADPEISACYDRANAVLGFDLKQICFDGPAESLTRSDYCQPAIFVTSVACWTAFGKRYPGCAFASAGGLSLGEWTALHVAGVLDFETTVRILEARGRFMQDACNARPGGMVSVMGLSVEQVQDICGQTGTTLANHNSDSQIVLSGTKEAVAAAEQAALAAGGKAIVLNVAGAFHSPLMAPARERLAVMLRDIAFATPRIPVFSNVTGQPHPAAGDAIREAMLRQVTEPVRWLSCVRASNVQTFIEFGPGKVLSGLIKRIDRANTVANVQDQGTLDGAASIAIA
jgi:[acyl-carrier-protein] S-malonyltransferase